MEMRGIILLLSICFSLALSFDKDIEYWKEGKEVDNSITSTVFSDFREKRQTPPTTNTTQDHHLYYTSEYIASERSNSLWFELNGRAGVNESSLKNYFLTYQVWRLPFLFPFYGHLLEFIAVTTGGFLYTGTFYHRRVHLTQFIAPLQANFNPSLNDSAKILVYSTVNRFTVQWDGVHNEDHVSDGPFSFQVSLFPNGSMHFVYREIPVLVNRINNNDHPVEVGLADSFYIDQGFIRYIYEYSRIRFNAIQNLTNSAYIITPVPNCIIAESCDECIDISKQGNFFCQWCSNLTRCSDGIDRHRQEWYLSDCYLNSTTSCGITSSPQPSPQPTIITNAPPPATTTFQLSTGAGVSIGLLILLVVILLSIITIGGILLMYGIKRPSSRIGMFIIENRPSKVASKSNKKGVEDYDGDKKIIIDEEEI